MTPEQKRAFLAPIALIVITVLFLGSSLLWDRLSSSMSPAPARSVQEKDNQNQKSNIGKIISDFGIKTLDGKSIHIRDLRGKIVIVNFWATWCPPCVVEFPILISLAEKSKGRVVLLALSSDKTESDIQRFITQHASNGVNMKAEGVFLALDPERKITRDVFKVTSYPESLIVGPDGKIMRHIIGGTDWDLPDVQDLFK